MPFVNTPGGKQGYSIQSGLQIIIDATWAGTRGYRPVTITASLAKPATADTLIAIEFQAGSWRTSPQAITLESEFELSQGSSTSSTTFFVPQYVDWNRLSWKIWVDGVLDKHLSLEEAGFNFGSSVRVSAATFRIGDAWKSWGNGQPLLQAASGGSVDSHSLGLLDLPESWLGYSTLDVLATTTDSLEFLQVSAPEKLSALLRWVRSGGNLLVTGAGIEYAKIAKLDKVLGVETARDYSQIMWQPNGAGKWRFLNFDQPAQPRLRDLVDLSMQNPELAESAPITAERSLRAFRPERVGDSRQWYTARLYGFGTVFAVLHGDAFAEMGNALERSSADDNFHWSTRHGNDPGTGNPDFNDFLIPDVGAAPVFAFQLLISLFVIAIGPVNYWLLRRRNQLPLLLVTVPTAALAVTVLLFAYGFLSDGFGARVRVRSMTLLDQNSGECSSWARLSYYAGIAPSDGLKMPADTAVYPLLPGRSGYNRSNRRHVSQQRSVQWTNDQNLTRGWLGSRTPTQYLTIRANETKKRLEFTKQGDQLAATNRLETEIVALVAQDHEGNIYSGGAIESDGTITLRPDSYVKAASTLRTLLVENTPQLPAGFVVNRRNRRNNYGSGSSEGLMELHYQAIISPTAIGWGNGTYVAVTSTGIEVPLGLEGAAETDSFHIVQGTWIRGIGEQGAGSRD